MFNVSGRSKASTVLLILLAWCVALPAAHARTELDALLSGKDRFQQDDLERLYQYRLDRGASNIALASTVLIRASERALREGKTGQARLYAEYALKISPDFPPGYLHHARVCWVQEPYRIDKLLAGCYQYLRAVLIRYLPAVFFLTGALMVVLGAVLLTIAVFSLLSLCKYFKLFIHDLGHRFPLPLPRHLACCCGIIILMLPLFFQWGMIMLLFYWLLLLFVYHPRREQFIIIIFTFILLLSPFMLQLLSQLMVTNSAGAFYPVYQVNEDNWDEGTASALKARLSTNPHDVDVLFALGLIDKREGRIAEAQQWYAKILSIDPLDCHAWCNLGNCLLAARKTDAALKHYGRSLELCPENAVGHYNLSRVQLMEYMFPESNRSFNTAKELDPDRINGFLQIYSEHMNRLVIDHTKLPHDFWQQTFTWTEDKERFTAYLWERYVTGVPYKYRYAVSFVCVIFILMLLVTERSRSNRALACEYCGCAVCRKCKQLIMEHRLCRQCTSIFKGKQDLMISIASKEQQAGIIERFHGRQIVMSKLFSILLPGSAQLLLDAPFRGTALLFCFFFLLISLAGGVNLIVNPFQMTPSYFASAVFGVALAAVYIYSLRHFNRSSVKLSQFISLIKVTRREFQIKR